MDTLEHRGNPVHFLRVGGSAKPGGEDEKKWTHPFSLSQQGMATDFVDELHRACEDSGKRLVDFFKIGLESIK